MYGTRTKTYQGKGAKLGETGKFEGEFKIHTNGTAPYLKETTDLFDKLYAAQEERVAALPKDPITIILPDGTEKEGHKFETTPLDIALGISKGLANSVVAAKVLYTEPVDSMDQVVAADDESDVGSDAGDDDEEEDGVQANMVKAWQKETVWDLSRPLEGSCKLELLKFDSPEGKDTFWHSSAHILGEALEQEYGCYLTIGPPLENGFYYDGFYGNHKLGPNDYEKIEKRIASIVKEDQKFQRLVVTKEEALELFAYNPFKLQLISTKVPDGSLTSVYRIGSLVDLCRGPHLPRTGVAKAFWVNKNSQAYWLGKAENDSLQRVYAISFPTEKMLKEYKKNVEEAMKRDHRLIGKKQDLFFFHPTMSPGSCFWTSHGAVIYNKLVDFIRREYRLRGFDEVITPNIFSEALFQQSGHCGNYKDNMYSMNIEGETWYLKPMNCPGHCMIFDQKVRSYKELPIRMADFGVLHRNELSGTLSGLTRVRRFQQDDAHIFCRPDQVQDEITHALEFLKFVYNTFGFDFSVCLSTRPKKAIGSRAIWDTAENGLKNALEACGIDYDLNPGDGAFYGPKIDIRLRDALNRYHQCGTIQLDFNLPIRFNLQYRTAETEESGDVHSVSEAANSPADDHQEKAGQNSAAVENVGSKAKADEITLGELKHGFERPVMVHRAILGSIERCTAILTEHYGGKWPFWLSPRQVMVVPVSDKYSDYADYLRKQLVRLGYEADADLSTRTMNKKVREAQVAAYNYIAVVGEKEQNDLTVTLRKRDSVRPLGTFGIAEMLDMFEKESEVNSDDLRTIQPFMGRLPEALAKLPEPLKNEEGCCHHHACENCEGEKTE
ncbi:conserved hypothetical protein [Perkinsus marinus ATCC 50983]|uniref:threonine--tRNA ligase n=1 Tax=Perkinsus marinus (strain ATCC 50983 / TXsc) TaxID=423536 RepID=C5KD37_PERM5|nr:conserved hypothetical protein [Perkinsus marinus ATCC 50983]EER17786.1 conserved hypothetical protein [Perkinsus marinus ATCC 50983]|eukprot:XP_002785990.1 conserved hypothetical protein [Perkinsus marinus ATCC 50983]